MTVDELLALNQEIAALVRAGVPLEQGLAELGNDMPGRLGRFATELAQRGARGEPLAQALSENTAGLPPEYQAVVVAGMRAGRLPAALEAIASSMRRLADTRRAAILATIYPLLVVAIAWIGFVFSCTLLAPRMMAAFNELGLPGTRFLGWLTWIGQNGVLWGPLLPLAIVALAVLAWLGATRSGGFLGGLADNITAATPWIGPMLHYSQAAAFLDILALLVEHEVPLPEALRLAGQSAGESQLAAAARQMATSLEAGQALTESITAPFPPLVRWLLQAGNRGNLLGPGLRHAAASYHRRARRQADLLRVFLPVVLTIGIGGSVTMAYALALLLPYIHLLRGLAQ